jgi:hypothetical protein
MIPHRIGVMCALALVAGCSADGVTGNDDLLSPSLDRDIAAVVGDAAAEDVEVMGGPAGLLGFDIAAASVGQPRIGCDDRTRQGLTITRTCTYVDGNGVAQTAYDPTTTARVDVHVTVEGTIEREHWEAEVSRFRELVVTGLAGTETSRTWNGTGNGAVSRSRHRENGETRTYEMTFTTQFRDVVVPVPRGDEPWPLSGSISRNVRVTVSGGPNDGRVIERVVTITFNGTRFVPIVVNGETHTFDLRLRRIVDE